MRRGTRRVASGLYAVGTVAALGCLGVTDSAAQHVEREERRFAVNGRPDLTLTTFDGSIEIDSWDRSDVLVVIEKRAASPEAAAEIVVQAAQTADRISVTIQPPESGREGRSWMGLSARLIVSVPRIADIRAWSGDGSIQAAHVSGTIDVRSGDGSVGLRELKGDLRVQTGDGSIRVEAFEGQIDAATGDGPVFVSGVLSGLRVRTGDGPVSIELAPGSATVNDWDVRTGDGSVAMTVPRDFNAEIDAGAGDGPVAVRNLALANQPPGRSGRALRGDIGSGGRRISIRTGDGPIVISSASPAP